jgi:hypothetical protein
MSPTGHIAPDLPPGVPTIRYLLRREIDTTRWDHCVATSLSPLIYGRSFYLDEMAAGQWDALVLDDYKAVMPLTWRSRFGIRYLCQPAFTQQTGIFSPAAITPHLVETFLREADRHFRFAEIYFNYSNAHQTFEPRTNFLLHLNAPYSQLSARYRKDLNRNLRLAQRSQLTYTKDFDLHTALTDFRREYAPRLPAIKEDDYRRFETLCLHLRQHDQLLTRAVFDEREQRLCSAVFLRDAHRFYLLHSTTVPAGRATEANHFLLDQFIREWAGSPMILDFEGSDRPGIAHFYSNFGSIDQPYFFYRRNRLPWPIRWLK